MIITRQKLFQDQEHPIKERIRNLGHNAVNYAVDNPLDTTAWAIGDVYLPGKIAGKLSKKLGGGVKGKVAKAALYGYAASPFGLTTAAINAKNKWKAKHNKKKE